jgi:hypothetical protein
MNQYEIVINWAFKYTKNILKGRVELGNDSLTSDVLFAEQNPLELFNHALSNIIYYSKIDYANTDDDAPEINFNLNEPLTDQIISKIDDAEKLFNDCIKRLERPITEEKEKFIGAIVMHTIIHFGQALRLQKMIINRVKYEKELIVNN